ncbi:hypothetical protein AB0J86_26700 [Micromonospora sp. NPDC049559]|uniref:hypothetical protein n=1 Tax=Micromonospora sp. NPDC049559 TaxID=3155923 RepID=UPI0034425069
MASTVPTGAPDPVAALTEFVERVAPFDPEPSAVQGTVELRYGHATETVPLTPHLAGALREALARYRDPADRGRCTNCGGHRLDENLHCPDCGRLHGVLGAMIAERMERDRWGATAPAE